LILKGRKLLLIPILVELEVFNLDGKKLNMVLESAVLNLLLNELVVCASQFSVQLLLVSSGDSRLFGRSVVQASSRLRSGWGCLSGSTCCRLVVAASSVRGH